MRLRLAFTEARQHRAFSRSLRIKVTVVMATDNATLLLMKQLKGAPCPRRCPRACVCPLPRPGAPRCADLNKNPIEGFSAGLKDDSDPFIWEIMIMGPPDTLYEGGFFQAEMTFPKNYPNHPPKLKFVSEFYHPNVYADGTVCISILHEPGDDAYGYESASERWLPVHTVESSACHASYRARTMATARRHAP